LYKITAFRLFNE